MTNDQTEIKPGQVWEVNMGASGPIQLRIDEASGVLVNFWRCHCEPTNGGESFSMRVHEDTIRSHGRLVQASPEEHLHTAARMYLASSNPGNLSATQARFLDALAAVCLEP